MLALAWPWAGSQSDRDLTVRLGASLCAGIGGHAGVAEIGGIHFAYRPLRSTPALSRAWRPAVLPDGRTVVFHGYFDNAPDVAAELGIQQGDPARLYGMAVERWGEEADRRIIGEYCAVIVDRANWRLRLARSALRAPPLVYYHDERLAAVASVPRALFAAGVEQRLNEAHVADSALNNFTDRESSWFENVIRVPVGSTVELKRGQPRELRKYYDLLLAPNVRMNSDAEYIARAHELLDDGVRACLSGFDRPGVALSGGLDSPQVAVRALAAAPHRGPLPTFTFHPEPGFDGRIEFAKVADERPFVEAFARMHPGLEPHFTANEGYGHDYRWNDFFHCMGGAPNGLCNMYVFHGLLSGAAKRGCDLLLIAEWGNYTFSDKGDWGYVEYFLKGHWRQLWLALSRPPNLTGSILRRFIARTASALLPASLWRMLRRALFPNDRFFLDLMQPLTQRHRRESGADDRLKKTGMIHQRYQPRNRRHAQKLLFLNSDGEAAEIYQAFEQMYGVAIRDPMAYRPFVEFCFGLPVEMFMRDGQLRWLAKQMAEGIMPEEQRANRVNGRWDADWHLRIGRRRKDYIAELDRLAQDERMSSILDIPRLRAALEDWPEHTETDPQKYFAPEFAVPRGLLTARFVNYVEGRNVL
ncbi:MAG: asparagine synthase-related protein [Sphingomicrobium sp.]